MSATLAPDPCIVVIFGASGDLTHRKLVPALFELCRGHGPGLPPGTAVIGVSRTPMSDEEFREKMRQSVRQFATVFDDAAWGRFAERLYYFTGDAVRPDMYPGLSARLESLAAQRGIALASGQAHLLFYLSVSPQLYEPIIACIGESGLVTEGKRWCSLNPAASPWQRIIVEKPFGHDLPSARSLNMALGRVFEEEATYRIDHYLGKELVQNILVMRFANMIFEPTWNRTGIDHVQVTAAETLGVGSRAANFYDTAGALRDMVQSHLLQVLALVAMEPPSVFDAEAVMREKIRLFGCAVAISPGEATSAAAFGRYGPSGRSDAKSGTHLAGTPAAAPELAYVDEPGVDTERKTETYAAMRVQFDNWRWAGVPFYLRSGKKLARKLTQVVVQFKRPPTNMFRHLTGETAHALERLPPNRLVINIAPSEGLSLLVLGKVPGMGLRIDAANLDLDYKERFGGESVEAYGPLLLDAMRGDRTLFKHRDEVESGWRICQPLLESASLRNHIETYAPGSWGPHAADALLHRDGHAWHNP